jgi:hypothetical protein
LCRSPPPSGPKKIIVGLVIFTIPFFNLVNQNVAPEIISAAIEIMSGKLFIILFVGLS